MSVISWSLALDAFAARLAAQRSALRSGDADVLAPFAPPPSLGPFPVQLEARAAALLQEAVEVRAALEVSLAATGRELQVVRRLVAAAPAPSGASYLDRAL